MRGESTSATRDALRQGSVEAPRLVAEDGNPDSGQCRGRMDDEKELRSLGCGRRRCTSNM